jgi:hypothetical protein
LRPAQAKIYGDPILTNKLDVLCNSIIPITQEAFKGESWSRSAHAKISDCMKNSYSKRLGM